MKIQKFNESYMSDKIEIDNLYKSSILHEYDILEESLNNMKEEVSDLINEYGDYNTEFPLTKGGVRLIFDDGYWKLKYIDRGTYNILTQKEVFGLLKFINNPEVYRNAKKYNL